MNEEVARMIEQREQEMRLKRLGLPWPDAPDKFVCPVCEREEAVVAIGLHEADVTPGTWATKCPHCQIRWWLSGQRGPWMLDHALERSGVLEGM